MPLPTIQQCAFPAVTSLICLLAYPSQWLLWRLEPKPLTKQQALLLNAYALVILLCYYRACFTDPGRVPPEWLPENHNGDEVDHVANDVSGQKRQRWCRKCQAFKPPRAHHCRTCGRCIPKMDHHCPWTANCVSHTTFPHFVRFLFYTVVGMTHLECLLASRMYWLWTQRHMPSYLGPSATDIFVLFLITAVNSLVDFGIFVLLVRTLWCLGANTTTIEGWEIERHETLVRRARALGGFLEGPNGTRIRIIKQEYPWDIGIYANIAQGMGSRNPISWFWPLARTPSIHSGLRFEDNGIEEPEFSWPPPDPDRMFHMDRTNRNLDPSTAFTQSFDPEEFRKRQQADQVRYLTPRGVSEVRRRQPFHVRYDHENAQNLEHNDRVVDNDYSEPESEGGAASWKLAPGEGEEGWRNSEGERLKDFGVDEDVEFYDEDDIPLAELLRRRRAAATNVES